jgi:hypothetical protein
LAFGMYVAETWRVGKKKWKYSRRDCIKCKKLLGLISDWMKFSFIIVLLI